MIDLGDPEKWPLEFCWVFGQTKWKILFWVNSKSYVKSVVSIHKVPKTKGCFECSKRCILSCLRVKDSLAKQSKLESLKGQWHNKISFLDLFKKQCPWLICDCFLCSLYKFCMTSTVISNIVFESHVVWRMTWSIPLFGFQDPDNLILHYPNWQLPNSHWKKFITLKNDKILFF